MTSIAVFNNKGGVGKTSLVYHLAWMYANLGYDVVVADLDPQANLTSMFLEDELLEELWADGRTDGTIYSSLRPLLEGTGDVKKPAVARPETGVVLVPGDMLLSGAEDELASNWPDCLDEKPRAFRVLSAIWRVLQVAAEDGGADFILLDVGPNIGALNRAALVAADLKHFRSLMPLAQEARKPMFALKPADGAIGGHVNAVRGCYRDFRALAREVARRCALPTPAP